MQSDWSRVFSITTQELDFSQPCGFCRLIKKIKLLKKPESRFRAKRAPYQICSKMTKLP